MSVRLTIIFLLFISLVSAWAEEEKKPTPKPDLWTATINLPETGIVVGATNSAKVLVENRAKDSVLEGKVKVELVIIQSDTSERASYFAEVDGMRHQETREAKFEGLNVTNNDSIRMLVILDPDDAIKESNEDNNRHIFTAWVKKTPKPEASPQPDASPKPADGEKPKEEAKKPEEG